MYVTARWSTVETEETVLVFSTSSLPFDIGGQRKEDLRGGSALTTADSERKMELVKVGLQESDRKRQQGG